MAFLEVGDGGTNWSGRGIGRRISLSHVPSSSQNQRIAKLSHFHINFSFPRWIWPQILSLQLLKNIYGAATERETVHHAGNEMISNFFSPCPFLLALRVYAPWVPL